MFLHWQDRRFSPEPVYHCWKSPTLGKLKANWQSGSWDGFVSLTLCRGCTLPWEASGAPPPHPAPPPSTIRSSTSARGATAETLLCWACCPGLPLLSVLTLSIHKFHNALLTFLPDAQKDCSPTRALRDCPVCRTEEESLTSSTLYGLL